MKRQILFLIVFLLINSCAASAEENRQRMQEPYHISLDVDKMCLQEGPYLSEIIDSLEYIWNMFPNTRSVPYCTDRV